MRERILLDDSALDLELSRMTDAGTDRVAVRAAAERDQRPWVVVNHLSRLVVDPERFPDDREVMRRVGMGAVYTRTSHGDALRADDAEHEGLLLRRYFDPYARAVSHLVQGRLGTCGRAIIVDVHSYPRHVLPYELHPHARRLTVCLGVDALHTPPWLQVAALGAFEPLGDVAVNEPFTGTYVPLRHYESDLRVSSVMIEMRRDDDGGLPAGVASAVARLVDAIGRYRG